MDLFGMGDALKGCARVYFRSARCSGRTTAMIESLKNGEPPRLQVEDKKHWKWEV